MVRDEVFPRGPQVNWVPVVELVTKLPAREGGRLGPLARGRGNTHPRESAGMSVLGSSPPKNT